MSCCLVSFCQIHVKLTKGKVANCENEREIWMKVSRLKIVHSLAAYTPTHTANSSFHCQKSTASTLNRWTQHIERKIMERSFAIVMCYSVLFCSAHNSSLARSFTFQCEALQSLPLEWKESRVEEMIIAALAIAARRANKQSPYSAYGATI